MRIDLRKMTPPLSFPFLFRWFIEGHLSNELQATNEKHLKLEPRAKCFRFKKKKKKK
jgi:hypothetical protein